MSYSLRSKCHLCESKDKCVDLAIIHGAVSAIHSVNGYSSGKKEFINKGHLGAGTIRLDCVNFRPDLKCAGGEG